ncbi:MAG: hypothetical protein J0H08_00725, partial [Rhizobiales bacterium]|nr:hypothetical protein [Hyphomicrobiales bacterium]
MKSDQPDLTLCDREPIHIPGSVQPYGTLLVVARSDLSIHYAAGRAEEMLGLGEPRGQPIGDVFGGRVADGIREAAESGRPFILHRIRSGAREALLDITVHAAGAWLLVELEPAPETASDDLLMILDTAGAAFEAAADRSGLYDAAAQE